MFNKPIWKKYLHLHYKRKLREKRRGTAYRDNSESVQWWREDSTLDSTKSWLSTYKAAKDKSKFSPRQLWRSQLQKRSKARTGKTVGSKRGKKYEDPHAPTYPGDLQMGLSMTLPYTMWI